MRLDDLEMYKVGMDIGEIIWDAVDKIDYFSKDTIGKQFVKAADSIAANISEGEGAFYQGDKLRYLYYARASLFETNTWLDKAVKRKLVPELATSELEDLLENCLKMINSNLKYQRSKKK